MHYRSFLIVFIFFTSCGIQNRLSKTEAAIQTARLKTAEEKTIIEAAKQSVDDKLQKHEVDSAIKDGYDAVLGQLNANLDTIQKKIEKLEATLQNRSNLRDARYYMTIVPLVATLDSFKLLSVQREKAYQLINESISSRAFNLFSMAAFFDPGVFNIPLSARPRIENMFSSAMDSIVELSSKYRDIPHVIRLVLVGYADESPIAEGSKLYSQLNNFASYSSPERQELNRILSQLRANEMMRNMKALITGRSIKFGSLAGIRFSYFNYGRGEIHPSDKIADYKADDERRRIVMFYWSVLPDLNRLNISGNNGKEPAMLKIEN